MGTKGRRRIVSDFDWYKKIDRIMGIYGSVQ